VREDDARRAAKGLNGRIVDDAEISTHLDKFDMKTTIWITGLGQHSGKGAVKGMCSKYGPIAFLGIKDKRKKRDWFCPNCGDLCYSLREACRLCDTPRPRENSEDRPWDAEKEEVEDTPHIPVTVRKRVVEEKGDEPAAKRSKVAERNGEASSKEKKKKKKALSKDYAGPVVAEVRFFDDVSAAAAVAELSGTFIGDSQVEVWVSPASEEGTTVLVRGVTAAHSRQEVEDHFQPVGNVEFCDVRAAEPSEVKRGG